MRKTLTLILSLTLVSAIALSGISLAQGRGARGKGGFPRAGFASVEVGSPGYVNTLIRFAAEIELGSDQVEKLRSIATDFEKEAATVSAEIRVAEIELREMLVKKDVSMADVEPKIDQIESLRSGLRFSMTRAQVEARSLLSDEQLGALESLKSQRPSRSFRRS